MDGLRLAHVILLSMWGGLVLGETVVEFSCRGELMEKPAARIHFYMDLFVELPLLAGILTTGSLLVLRAWPLAPLHWAKIGCALVALGVNATCAYWVILRYRRADGGAARAHFARRIRSAWIGVPFALCALLIGLTYFHPWQ